MKAGKPQVFTTGHRSERTARADKRKCKHRGYPTLLDFSEGGGVVLDVLAVERLDRYARTPRRRGRLSLGRACKALLAFAIPESSKSRRGALFIEMSRRGLLRNSYSTSRTTIASTWGSGGFGSGHPLWVLTTPRGSASLFGDRPFRCRQRSTLPKRRGRAYKPPILPKYDQCASRNEWPGRQRTW